MGDWGVHEWTYFKQKSLRTGYHCHYKYLDDMFVPALINKIDDMDNCL